MALRVGGDTRSATFETQSVFFRKESTEMENLDCWEWRSPRPRPWRALQSPVYIRKKAAANKREKKTQKFKERKQKT